MTRKHGILLFISACVPGCGQMYQGYMKRGVSLLAAFCGVTTIAIILEIGALAVLLPLVWLYSFFDSYNLRSLQSAGAVPADAFLFGLNEMDSEKLSELCRKRHSIIGWTLVLLGVYALFETFVGRVMSVVSDYFEMYWLYDIVMHDLPRMAVTAGVILLGLWFIRGPKSKPADDIPAFTPPAPATEEEAPHGDE